MLDFGQTLTGIEIDDLLKTVLMLIRLFGNQTALVQLGVRL